MHVRRLEGSNWNNLSNKSINSLDNLYLFCILCKSRLINNLRLIRSCKSAVLLEPNGKETVSKVKRIQADCQISDAFENAPCPYFWWWRIDSGAKYAPVPTEIV